MANTNKPAATKPAKTPAKTSQEGVEKKTTATKKKEPKLTDKVCVTSCFYGSLTYINKHTGFTVEWDHFGDTAYMTVDELIAMRNGQRAFFENQWVLLTGDNADAGIEFLQLEKYFDTRKDAEITMYDYCRKHNIVIECTEYDKHERR